MVPRGGRISFLLHCGSLQVALLQWLVLYVHARVAALIGLSVLRGEVES